MYDSDTDGGDGRAIKPIRPAQPSSVLQIATTSCRPVDTRLPHLGRASLIRFRGSRPSPMSLARSVGRTSFAKIKSARVASRRAISELEKTSRALLALSGHSAECGSSASRFHILSTPLPGFRIHLVIRSTLETPALASRDDCYNGYVVLVTFLNVNYVEEFFVLDEPLGVLKEQIDRMLALALGVARDVGRDDDVWVSPERMAVR